MSRVQNETALQQLNAEEIRQLAEVQQTPSVSFYLPTWESGRETRQGRIRLGNLLDTAKSKFQEAFPDQALEGLEDVAAKVDDEQFWQHQGKGLAIFCYADQCHMYQLHHDTDEAVSVGQTLQLHPLVCQLSCAQQYHVLALTWEKAELYQGDHDALKLVENDPWPASFDDLVTPRDPETQLQHHGHESNHAGGAVETTMYHGHGDGEEKVEADRRNYLTRVAQLLKKELQGSHGPLLVVATDEVHGHFHQECEHQNQHHVSGSPAGMDAHQLHQKVHASVEEVLAQPSRSWEESIGNRKARQQASTDTREILHAAELGRIEALLVPQRFTVWGQFDMEQRKLERHIHRKDDSIDLTNQAIVQTLLHGGTVDCLPEDDMPDNADMAALFRY